MVQRDTWYTIRRVNSGIDPRKAKNGKQGSEESRGIGCISAALPPDLNVY